MFGLLKRPSDAKGRIGLAIHGDQIALAIVTREGDSVLLTRCEMLSIDPAGGAQAIVGALRAGGLPRLPASVVLHAEDYQLVIVEAPDVPPAEMRTAIRWRLKDAIDFRVEEAIIDVFDVPARNRGGNGRMMYAVAARRKAVDRYAAALNSFPTFDVIDVPELCLRNLAAGLPGAADGIAILYLGDTGATMVLVRGSTFYFARQMDFKATQRSAASSDANAQLDTAGIVLELQRSLDYYESHFDQPPITQIAVAPGGPRADTLMAALRRDTGFEIGVLDLSSMLSYASPVAPECQSACLMAVGAAMRADSRPL